MTDWLGADISPRTAQVVMLIAWGTLWLSIGLRVAGYRFRWKTVAVPMGLFLLITTAFCISVWQQNGKADVVVISSNAILCESDNQQSPPVSGAVVREGEIVETLRRRGDWLQVRTKNGQTGWLSNKLAEII